MKKTQILVCDDEPGVRESLTLILGREYELLYATNGAQAVEKIREHNPAIAILDIKMPQMDGLEALREIKRLKPGIRVLIVTGYDSSDVANQAIQMGAEDYLVKPFDRHRVITQVQSILSS